MVHLSEFPDKARDMLINQDLMQFDTTPWAKAPDMSTAKVCVVSTAGLHRSDDRPFQLMSTEYRIIPNDVNLSDLVMSHISTNFDRSGFQQDVNVALPLDRLRELEAEGAIGELAEYHYSFMGATPPDRLEAPARDLAGILKQADVDAVFLFPV